MAIDGAMKNDILLDMVHAGHISKMEYKTYVLFELNDLGKEYLSNMCESILMEEPLEINGDHCMWHDGRRSTWRHIKITVNKINQMISGEANDKYGNRIDKQYDTGDSLNLGDLYYR